ncbi:Ig-like domain-containing protein [Candidatus Curtissbacteria bacterium]|nr:Ig-like domain-containing protein [Candidatus Curtissbacteria bacterium]
MAEIIEKRGPIVKTSKGWPLNRLGVIILLILIVIVVFLVSKPFFSQKAPASPTTVSGQITTPPAGQIVKANELPIELAVGDSKKVAKVQFWAKTYTEGKWEVIGEVSKAPFKFDWQIPQNYQNKAVAITAHIYLKDGNIVKDPGGWREGIIILSQ